MEHRAERTSLLGAAVAVSLSAAVFAYGVVVDLGKYVLIGLGIGVVAWLLLREHEVLSRSWLLVMVVSMVLMMLGMEK